MIVSVFFACMIFPLVGRVCDKIQPKKMVPFAYLFRSFTTLLFWLLDKPDTWQAYAVCVSIVVASVVETITMDTIFYKNLPQETRGVFNGLYSFSG